MVSRCDYKVVVMGDAGVGKTQLLSRYIYSEYREGHTPTVGVDLGLKRLAIGSRPVNIHFWDTAGQERFHAMSDRLYLKNASGVVVVYDVTNQKTFNNVASWKRRIDTCESIEGEVACILVGNKTDLGEDRVISTNQGLQWADRHSMMFLESSAKMGDNVEQVFRVLVGEIDRQHIERRMSTEFQLGEMSHRLLNRPPTYPAESTACCS